jgi:glutamine---fructose-6-phosphate transaminase (isomerizing)
MCGITGVIKYPNSNMSNNKLVSAWEHMFKSSLRRGSDASGIVTVTQEEMNTFKNSNDVKSLLSSSSYGFIKEKLTDLPSNNFFAIIGHSRLETNGRSSLNSNNQPVLRDGLALFHNGIVVNDQLLRESFHLESYPEVDSDCIAQLLLKFNVESNPKDALAQIYRLIVGNSTLAFVTERNMTCILTTNNGSLFLFQDYEAGYLLFSSEPQFIKSCLEKQRMGKGSDSIYQIPRNSFVELSFANNKLFEIINFEDVARPGSLSDTKSEGKPSRLKRISYMSSEFPNFDSLKRCTICILPHTFPGLTFNSNGVCSYCSSQIQRKVPLGIEQLFKDLGVDPTAKSNVPILVGVSGGRDSCYGLHFLKKVLNLDVVAYTYDWGMVTDLARRNIASICGELGIEHIIVAPNTAKKLRNVRLNLMAWIKNPDLGLIPLLMAGDKQFYLYAHKLRKNRKFSSAVLCSGNSFESTDFKVAFATVSKQTTDGLLGSMSLSQKVKLLSYYILGVFRNPRYFNSSIIDTLSAFRSSYFLKSDYIHLYNYIDWDEQEILRTLRDIYGWENAQDTKSTWRIGDGTSAFYNYVYYCVAGFTESDTFRSHQIRAGVMSRGDALELVKIENSPRPDALEWYAQRVGIRLDEVLNSVHNMKKLWQ